MPWNPETQTYDPRPVDPEIEYVKKALLDAANSKSDECIPWTFMREFGAKIYHRLPSDDENSKGIHSTLRIVKEIADGPPPGDRRYWAVNTCRSYIAGCLCPAHIGYLTGPQKAVEMHRRMRANGGRPGMGVAKLTPEEVMEVRESRAPDLALARRFRVSPAAINSIRKGRTWKHMDDWTPIDPETGNVAIDLPPAPPVDDEAMAAMAGMSVEEFRQERDAMRARANGVETGDEF